MRTKRCAYHLASSLCLVLTLSGLLSGQSANSARPQEESDQQSERDAVQKRDQWFLQGRDARPGQTAASLHRKAAQQKLRMRALRAQKLAAAAMLHPDLTPSAGAWTSLGPAPLVSDGNSFGSVTGRVTSVAIDPADNTGNTVFASGAQGGVWKSTNAAATNPDGVTWTPLTDAQPTLASGTIAIQPGNSNPSASVVLVGTGEGNASADSYFGMGILRSTDGGSTWTLISNAGTTSLEGLGTTRMAFSIASPNTVVAAMKSTGVGYDNGSLKTDTTQGLYTSTDAGQTWTHDQLVEPGGQQTTSVSATSVVYNAAQGQFFAAVRYHGFYSSPDGINWTRLAAQPGAAGQLSTTNCPAQPTWDSNGIYNCRVYRGEIAVVPGRNEMYVWYLAFTYITSNSVGFVDEGIWKSVDGGQTWTSISTSAIDNCGDANNAGCGVYQGWYDLTLTAVPNGASSTDLYAGAVNLFKCSITSSNLSCSTQPFMNLTHVYGCDASHVHPDQHDVASTITGSGTDLMYFGNDGGVYRALDGFTGLNSGSCTANKFDSLNQNLGPLTQFVGMSQDAANAAVVLGGTQDNGTEANGSATTSTAWTTVQGGDGGFNAIDPHSTGSWFASFPDSGNGSLDIRHCPNGINCTDSTFSAVVTSTSVGGDDGPFYTFYTLDPQSTSAMLVGTCRIWRGPRLGGTFTVLSPKLDSVNEPVCTGGELNTVRSIAAGGPTDSNGSQVIYATTNGVGPYSYTVNSGLEWSGRVWVTTNATGGASYFQDITGYINSDHEPISSVVVDPSDATGLTAYVGIMGFTGNGAGYHVFKTTDANAWVDWSGTGTFALPDSPVNALVIDSSTQTIYAASDVGVFESSTVAPIWTEVGPAAGTTGFLPNVAVTGLALFNSGGQKLLRASTYGRGIWQFDVLKNPPTPVFYLTVSPPGSFEYFSGQDFTVPGTLTALSGYNSAVSLSCSSAPPTSCQAFSGGLPVTCAGSSGPVVPLPQGATATLRTNSTAGFYCFNMHAAGTDPSGITQDQTVFLNFFDLTITAMSPASVTIPRGSTSQSINFDLVLNGWNSQPSPIFSCVLPAALASTTCSFSQPYGYNGTNPMTLTMTVPPTTQPGTYSVTIQAYVTGAGATAPSQQTLTVVVTKNTTFLFSEPSTFPNVKAGSAGSTGPITLSSLDGFSGTVQLSCAPAYPLDSCSVSPSSVNVGSNAVIVNVTIVASNVEQSQAVVTGTSGAITQTVNIPFNVGSYGIPQPNSFPSVLAGGSTSTSITLSGIIWYSGTVQATCDASAIAGAQCALMPASPYVLMPNSGGDSTATFSATVNIPASAAPGVYNIAINTADTAGKPTASANIPLTIQQDYQVGAITLASGSSGSVSPGGSASYNFNVAPVGATYSGNIALGCSISPATTTMRCLLSPASVNPGGQSTAVAMTVSTQANSVAQSALFTRLAGLALVLPIVGLFSAWPRKRHRQLAAVGVVLWLVFTLSCGGGAGGGSGGGTGGTPPGTYTITVSGTPASLSEPKGQSAQFQVN